MWCIEVELLDPTTREFKWNVLHSSGLCSRPHTYNTREQAQRVADVCYPEQYAIKARVVEAT